MRPHFVIITLLKLRDICPVLRRGGLLVGGGLDSDSAICPETFSTLYRNANNLYTAGLLPGNGRTSPW